MLNLLMNKYTILGLIFVIISGTIYFMYWNMNRWEAKAKEFEVRLEAMTAARDLLIELDSIRAKQDGIQAERRNEVEKGISSGNREYFQK